MDLYLSEVPSQLKVHRFAQIVTYYCPWRLVSAVHHSVVSAEGFPSWQIKHKVLEAFVSCVSSTFFQSARSGSHLYPAHRNTVRSGHRVMVLHTLVGIRHLRGCLTLAFCAFIIAHSWLFVKHFFVKSYIFSRRYLTRTSPKENGRESPSPSQLDTIAPTFRTFFHSHLFCTLIVSHFKAFVKRFFTFFFLAFPSLCGGTSLPLDCQRDFSRTWYSLFPFDILIVSQLG